MSGSTKAETFSIQEPEITAESRLQELGLSLPGQVPYQLNSLFPKLTGWGWKRQIKKKHKLVLKVNGLLEQCLLPGEKVLYVAKGNRYSFLEFYFLGVWAATINHTVFVLTNVRLLMFRTDSKGTPKKTYWMIFYSQIKKFKGSWTGMLSLQLTDKRKLSFSGFSRADRQVMPKIFQTALQNYQEQGFDPETSQSLENLCSHCLEQVPRKQYVCEGCQATYWKPSQLAWRSFIFPSWGDFLMGHTTIALLEMLGGIVTWTVMLAMVSLGIAQGEMGLVLTGLMVFVIGNGLDALVTAHVAEKGLHPAPKATSAVQQVQLADNAVAGADQ